VQPPGGSRQCAHWAEHIDVAVDGDLPVVRVVKFTTVEANLQERFLSLSDGTVAAFCRDCGLPALEMQANDRDRATRSHCSRCAKRAARATQPYVPKIATTYLGRSTMVMLYSLIALGVAPRLQFED
jgi:hypothetical protein